MGTDESTRGADKANIGRVQGAFDGAVLDV
jgi:hypothetical protein